MKKSKNHDWEVTIRATVTKTYTVTANNEQDAIEQAHQVFSVLNDDIPEDYNQETITLKSKP